jgi:hypothetical protein
MALVYVSEYSGLASTDQSDSVAILALPPTSEYSVIVSAASSGASRSILPTTKFIEFSCDTTCSIAIGPSPGSLNTGSALLTNQRLNANERVIRRVPFQQQSSGPGVYNTVTTAYSVFTTANV